MRGLIFLLCLIDLSAVLRANSVDTLDPHEVRSETLKGYGYYNLYLEYFAYEQAYKPRTFHVTGFAPAKKPSSRSNLPFKEFVAGPDKKKIEITNPTSVYPFEEKYRDYRITSNQPYGTETQFLVYAFSPVPSGNFYPRDALIDMLNEFNAFLKTRAKFINKTAHAPPFNYPLEQEKHTTANLVVIVSDDPACLVELNYRQVGKITGEVLLIPEKALAQMPSGWRVPKDRVRRVFVWREGVALPRMTQEGIWMWTGVCRWIWQSPGWLLPQFYR